MVIALSLFLHFGCADPAYLDGVEGQLSSMTVLRATLKNRASDGAASEPCVRGSGFKPELPDSGKMLMRV